MLMFASHLSLTAYDKKDKKKTEVKTYNKTIPTAVWISRLDTISYRGSSLSFFDYQQVASLWLGVKYHHLTPWSVIALCSLSWTFGKQIKAVIASIYDLENTFFFYKVL